MRQLKATAPMKNMETTRFTLVPLGFQRQQARETRPERHADFLGGLFSCTHITNTAPDIGLHISI